jgi:hypothetical protein
MLSSHAKGEGASRAKGGRLFIECYPVAGFPLYDGFNSLGSGRKTRYDLARMGAASG